VEDFVFERRHFMKMFMAKVEPHVYALLRMVSGFLFLCHGSQKLFGIPGAMPGDAPPFIIYGAGSIELFGGLMIMIGIYTCWAAFICSGEMAVAYWTVHGLREPLPIQNNGELAVLYCFIFLLISSQGGGIWSIDALKAGKTPAR
jgi:putative oxidoreductase